VAAFAPLSSIRSRAAVTVRSGAMDAARAARLTEDWLERHVTVEPPAPDAVAAVRGALALVPEPGAAAAITCADGRPRIAALAGGALYVVWAVPGSAAVRDAARCRRVPLDPATTAVELSERRDPGAVVRHWWFEVDDEPLVFRTTGEDEPERFARALASVLGWPQ
jgi:hypothetical protein